MVQIHSYLGALTAALQSAFGARLAYVGLQGSYLRGEQTENSDIDIMVLINGLTPADMAVYRNIVKQLDDAEHSCGFLCGTEEFAAWNPQEILHLLYSTRDHYGTLSDFVPPYSPVDHRNYVLLSLGNLYHALVHRYVHRGAQRSAEKLSSHAKELFFLLQDIALLRTGNFPENRAALVSSLNEEDRTVYRIVIEDARGAEYDFDAAFAAVFAWCRDRILEFGGKI